MPYTSDSWTFGHVPTTFKRLPTVNRWGVLHGFYSDQRDDQELSNSAPDMPSGVGFRILANRNIWRFPNILSSGRGFGDQFDISQYGFHDLTGAMFISRTGPRKYDRDMYESHTDGALAWTFDASRNSAVYGASGTNQPASVRFLCLIRAYQA